MKRLFLSILIMGAATPLLAEKGWTPVSAEDAEFERHMRVCRQIIEQYGCDNSSGPWLVFKYLKDAGTPASLRALKACIQMGCVPASYLNMI